jgi:tight adherence protein C
MFSNLALSGTMRIALLALIFLLVVIGVMLISNLLGNRALVRGRLNEVKGNGAQAVAGTSLRRDNVALGWQRLADRIEKAGISLVDTRGDSVRAKLIAAGYTAPVAPKIYTLSRLILLFALPAIYVFFAHAGDNQPSPVKLYLIGTGLAIAGLYFPNLWVTAKADRRRNDIINGFPDCLDLMLVCVEAGLGMEAAFDRVGREMVDSHPLVSQLLSMVTLELRAGSTREEALRNMANRAQVDEIRSFSTLLIQSDKLGSSVGETLRVYATEMRERRRMRAEEKAHRLPVLLSVPLVACMLPVMIGVLMLPAVIRVMREVIPNLGGN